MVYVVTISQVPFADMAQHAIEPRLLPRRQGTEENGNGNHQPRLAPPPRNAWLFQSNPVLFDLGGALRSLKEQVWSVSRYAREINRGDRVYLWQAGRQGGVAAVAEIVEPARLQPEPAEQIPFARVARAFAGQRLRARLQVLKIIDPVLSRGSIASRPELSGLGILRCPRGTNFRLSLDQWRALSDLIADGQA